jgi:hypothetical protein
LWKGKAAVNEHAAPSATVQAPSQHQPSAMVDTTAQFLVPDSPELPETSGTVAYNGRIMNLLDSEDLLDMMSSYEEYAIANMELEALMEIEPEQGGTMSPAPEALMEIEPEQGGTMSPAPEALVEQPEQGGAMSPAPEALMEIEPEQGGIMTPAPEAVVEEPEQGGIMTPAPEAELEDIHMASASPALTN